MSPNTPHTPHDLANQDKTNAASGNGSYDAPVQLAPGKIIMDKFVVIEHLGTGGMGSVFKVQHLHLKTFYALKCLNHKQGNDAIWRRFENEARAANRLDHPNLIKVHDSGLLPDGQPYFVMDLVEGTTLHQELARRGTLKLTEALKIFIQVGFALAYAHANGVIHRDIKPSNIMLVKGATGSLGGTVKVVDFGIAKLTGKDEFNQQTLTKTGEIFGSPLYMSPEQCMGVGVDHRSDLYSLGCVIYEALTGCPPVVGDNALSTMMKHQSETPLAMRQASLGLDFPESIEYVVAKLLEKDPDKRYQNASLLTADLVAIEQGQLFKEHEVSELGRTLVTKQGVRGSRPAPASFNLSTVAWAVLILIIGFVLGFFSAKMFSQKDPVKEKPVAGAPEKIGQFDSTHMPTGMEVPTENRFADLDSKPFSTLYMGGKKRIFEFPKQAHIATICDGGWTPKAVARATICFYPFEPFYLCFGREFSASPNVFKKFRPDEVRGIRLNGFLSNLYQILGTISGYRNLEDIGLESSAFEKRDLAPLKKMKKLRYLNVRGTRVSGQDLTELSVLPQLHALNCSGIADISPLLEKLKGSTAMEGLSVSTCALSRQDLQNISQIPSLHFLDLTRNYNVTDQTLPLLLPLKNLVALDLECCPITKASLPTFKAMPKLQRLQLSCKCISQKEKDEINKDLPRVSINWKIEDSQ